MPLETCLNRISRRCSDLLAEAVVIEPRAAVPAFSFFATLKSYSQSQFGLWMSEEACNLLNVKWAMDPKPAGEDMFYVSMASSIPKNGLL